MGYSLPDFQLIWSNFKIEIFQLQTALNPYEFWRASFYPTSDDHLPIGNSLPDFQPNRSNFLAGLPLFFSLPGRKGVDTLGGLRASYTLRHPVHVKIDCGFGNWVYSSAPTITQKRSKKDVVAVARISDHSALPSSARSEASISFQIQCCKIWKGRRSCCEFFQLQIALNP